MKITRFQKVCNVPGNGTKTEIVEWFEFEGLKIQGTQRGRWYFDAKMNGRKYQRLYIDTDTRCVLGKPNETSPWERVVEFTQINSVTL